MLELTKEFKDRVVVTLLKSRENYDGSDSDFARRFGLNKSVYSRLINGERDRLIKEAQWLTIARELNVSIKERSRNIARTEVFNRIEEEVKFCKEFSKAMIFVDETEIGKTVTGKHLGLTLKNCFYIDASQAKTKQQFIRLMSKTVGADFNGKYVDVKSNLKYYLGQLDNPVVIIDEAGDLEYTAFLELKEMWNATENVCGWYMMGADGLREKMQRGISGKKVGYKEIFSRYSSRYSAIVPVDRNERLAFYRKLISDVFKANSSDLEHMNEIVKRCMVSDANGQIGGLRRLDSLLILNQ